jgi:hypothetical protein
MMHFDGINRSLVNLLALTTCRWPGENGWRKNGPTLPVATCDDSALLITGGIAALLVPGTLLTKVLVADAFLWMAGGLAVTFGVIVLVEDRQTRAARNISKSK